jgi:hypothetical protein
MNEGEGGPRIFANGCFSRSRLAMCQHNHETKMYTRAKNRTVRRFASKERVAMVPKVIAVESSFLCKIAICKCDGVMHKGPPGVTGWNFKVISR